MASFSNQLKNRVSLRGTMSTATSIKVNKNRHKREVLCSNIKKEITIYNDENNYTSYEIFNRVLSNHIAQSDRLFNEKPNEMSSLISNKSGMQKTAPLNSIIEYLCEKDLDKNFEFLTAFLEEITNANKTLNTIGQNSQNKKHNKSAKNNGGQTPRKNTKQKNGAPVRPIPAPRTNRAPVRPIPAPRKTHSKNTKQNPNHLPK